MKKTILLFIAVLFAFCVMGQNGFNQIQRADTINKMPVATEIVEIPGDTSYYMKYYLLEVRGDSLCLSGGDCLVEIDDDSVEFPPVAYTPSGSKVLKYNGTTWSWQVDNQGFLSMYTAGNFEDFRTVINQSSGATDLEFISPDSTIYTKWRSGLGSEIMDLYINPDKVDISFTNELDTIYNFDGTIIVHGDTIKTDSLLISQIVSDSLATFSASDDQVLSIDSTGRLFALSIEDGNTVYFNDTVDDADSDPTNELDSKWTLTSGDIYRESAVAINYSTPTYPLEVYPHAGSSAGDYISYIGESGTGIGVFFRRPTTSAGEVMSVQGNLKTTGTLLTSALNAGTSGQVLTSGGAGANWSWTTPVDNNTTYSAGTGLTLAGTTFNADLAGINYWTDGGGYLYHDEQVSVGTSSIYPLFQTYGTNIFKYRNLANMVFTTTTYSATPTGTGNVMIGNNNGLTLTTGYSNFLLGAASGQNITTGYSNIYVGEAAGRDNAAGYRNIGLGLNALRGASSRDDIAIGRHSGYYSSGDANVFLGYFAGEGQSGLSTGSNNIFIGNSSGKLYTSGLYNIGIGETSMYNLTSGRYNVAIGRRSLYSNSSAWYNVALGYYAGQANTTGQNNVYIGRESGNLNDGSSNVFIGSESGENLTATSNTLIIDNSNTATPLIWGDFSSNFVNVNGSLGINDSSPSYSLDVNGTGRFVDDVNMDSDLEVTGSIDVGDQIQGNAINITGYNSTGKLTRVSIGSNISLSSGTLSASIPYHSITAAKMVKTSNTSLSTAAGQQVINWTSTEIDNGDITPDPTTDESFTVTTAGIYEITFNLRFTGDDDALGTVYIDVNDVANTNLQKIVWINPFSNSCDVGLTTMLDLDASDEITVTFFQNGSDGGLDVTDCVNLGNFHIKRID